MRSDLVVLRCVFIGAQDGVAHALSLMSLPLIHVRLLDRVLLSMLLHLLHLIQLSLHIVDHLVIGRFDLVQFEDCAGNLRRNWIACHAGHFTVLDLI